MMSEHVVTERLGPWYSFCPVCGEYAPHYSILRPIEEYDYLPTKYTYSLPIITALPCNHHWEGEGELVRDTLTVHWEPPTKVIDHEMFLYIEKRSL